ncbi:MAG: hypothetical protein MJZ31_05715 [Bacteroidales bacterium]|nr:hypothetical protein [Bacteroidales bacterium]
MGKSIVYATICAVALMVSSCGGAKQVVQQSKQAFGRTQTVPCFAPDTKDEFAATGIYMGSSRQKGECIKNALENAKQQVYAKFHHKYKGVIKDYSNTYGNNKGNDIESKLERGGKQALDVVLNDVQAWCTEFGDIQDDGMVECYVAIKVPKKQVAQETAKTIENLLTNDEKKMIDFHEDRFFKELEKEWEEFDNELK